MEIKDIDHQYNEEMVEKCLTKFRKMLADESGKGNRFLEHLFKSFTINPDLVKIVNSNDSPNGFLRCDLTNQKLITFEKLQEYVHIYNTKLNELTQMPDETDENFDLRKRLYSDSLKSTNPYAINNCIAVTTEKTDKVLSLEAIKALNIIQQEIIDNIESYPAFRWLPARVNASNTASTTSATEKFNKKKSAASKKKSESKSQRTTSVRKITKSDNKKSSMTRLVASSSNDGGNTLGDVFDFSKLLNN